MARVTKMGHLALIASLLGGVAIAPMLLPGPANAQSGSRVCGRQWWNDGEEIWKIYEVGKADEFVCSLARDGGGSEQDPSRTKKLVNVLLNDGEDYTTADVYLWKCETTSATLRLTARDDDPLRLVFKDDGTPWSDKTDRSDICNNMNKSDSLGQMKAYWAVKNSRTDGHWWFYHG